MRNSYLVIILVLLLSCKTSKEISRKQLVNTNIYKHFENLKKSSNNKNLTRFLIEFPKGADLHSHLSGAVSSKKLINIAVENNYSFAFDKSTGKFLKFLIDASTASTAMNVKGAASITASDKRAIIDVLEIDDSDHDGSSAGRINTFNNIFGVLDELTDNTDIMPLLVRECMLDASDQNISYLELKLNPLGRVNTCGEITKVDVLTTNLVGAVNRTNEMLQRRGRKTVEVRFIGATTRWSTLKPGGESDTHPEINCSIGNCGRRLDQLYYLSTGIIPKSFVAIDLVGLPESDIVKPKDTSVLEYFNLLNSKFGNTNISMHAGESHDPKNNHILEAISFGAKRIGHAFNMVQVKPAIEKVCKESVGIEISLTSNLALGFPSSGNLSDHPFIKYFDNRICSDDGNFPVSLNTDDAGIFNTTLSNEFLIAVQAFDLDYEDIKTLSRNSIEKMAFADHETRRKLLERWKKDIKAFEIKYNTK